MSRVARSCVLVHIYQLCTLLDTWVSVEFVPVHTCQLHVLYDNDVVSEFLLHCWSVICSFFDWVWLAHARLFRLPWVAVPATLGGWDSRARAGGRPSLL